MSLSTEQKNKIRRFVYKFLGNFIESKEHRKKLVSADNVNRFWSRAFTHETYSQDNYEELEWFGDRKFGSTFPDYLIANYPGMKNDQYTDIFHHYTGNEFFGQIDLGFGEVLVAKAVPRPLPFEIKADLIEAFNGALYKAAENVEKWSGYRICYQFAFYIYDTLGHGKNIKVLGDLRNPKSIVQQNLRQLDNQADKNVIEKVTFLGDNSVKIQIVLTDKIMMVLKEFQIDSKRLIASVVAPNKKTASTQAYQQADQYLESIGVDRNLADEYKFDRIFDSSPELKKYRQPVYNKMDRLGIAFLRIKKPTKTKDKGGEGETVRVTASYQSGDEQLVLTKYFYFSQQNQERYKFILDYFLNQFQG